MLSIIDSSLSNLIFIGLVILIIFDESYAKNIEVEVKNGKVFGTTEIFDGRRVNVFLGIPYAQPPIGRLRFKKPIPEEKWSEPLNATKWPNPCVQPPIFIESMQNKNLSEDCLYLNIWTPISKRSNRLKAVMFFMHGGAFMLGSSNVPRYNGRILSTKGDVVVVTINYRLNTLGFLYTGTDDAPGNMGLWDQALALEWVKNNIRSFGGNPNQITIFGESAGSISTSLHILSPVSRNLYQNAILMSGATIDGQTADEPETVLDYWAKGSKLVGCNNRNSAKLNRKIINCLMNASADALSTIPLIRMSIDVANNQIRLPPLVVVDRQFLPQMPTKMLKNGNFKKNLNLMIGNSEDEGSLLLTLYYDSNKFSPTSPKNYSLTEAYNELKDITNSMVLKTKANGEEVSKHYFANITDRSDRHLFIRTIGIAFGDVIITCPTTGFAKSLFKSDPKNSNVYQYYFNSKVGPERPFCSNWMGVCHTLDIEPVFGQPFVDKNSLKRETEVSAQMIQFFTDFAKTGKPSAQNVKEWPKYTIGKNRITAPYYEISNKPSNGFGKQFKVNECENLWNKYL